MLAAVEAAEAREALRTGSRPPPATSCAPSDERHNAEVLELRAQLTAQQGKITELLQVPHSGLPHLSQPCPVCAAHSAPRDTHDTPPALCHSQPRAPSPNSSPAQRYP